MKRLLVIWLLLLLGSLQTMAQVSEKLENFRGKVLPQFASYFTQAVITENGNLDLAATESYTAFQADSKQTVMARICGAWPDSPVLVQYGSKREVWGRSAESGTIEMLDVYDLNAPPPAGQPRISLPSYPWFFYVGGQFGFDNQNSVNLALNLRVGFYLLKDRWDLATTFSGGLTGSTLPGGEATGWVNTGLMSRVHFPIKKLGLSPNVGGQVTVSLYGAAPATVSAALVLGVSWYIGIGSLDLGISIGDIVSGSGGYTMSPQIRRNK